MDFKLPTDPQDDLVPSIGDKPTSESGPNDKSSGAPKLFTQSNASPNSSVPPKPLARKNKYEPIVPVKPITVGGRRKGLVIIISILAVIILAGAGAFAYFYYISNSPEMVLSEAMINMAKLDSVTSKANVDMSVNVIKTNMPYVASGQSQSLKLSIDSKADNREGVKAEGLLEVALDGGMVGSSSDKAQAKLNFVNMDKEVYLKLANLTLPSKMASMMPLDLESIYNKWVKVDNVEKSDKFKIGDLNKFANLDEATTKTLHDIYGRHQFMNIIRVTNDGDLKRFELQIDGEALLAMAKEMSDVIYKEESFNYDKIPQEVIDQLSNIKIVVWVEPKTKMIHKMQMAFNEDINIDRDNIIGLDISLTFEYSNFNENLDITAPTDFITSEELIQEVTAGMMPDNSDNMNTVQPGMTEDKDTDGDGLSNRLENSLGTDPMELDSDGDGFSDGDEFTGGYNPAGKGRLWEVDWTVNQKRNILIEFGESSISTLMAMTDEQIECAYINTLQEHFGEDVPKMDGCNVNIQRG